MVGGRFCYETVFLYLLIVMALVALVAIMLFGNVIIGLMVAVLYGVAISGIAFVCCNPDEEDDWKR